MTALFSPLTSWMSAAITVRHYIDPATTAMVTQIVAGIVISVGVAVGLFWRKIVLLFQNMRIKRTQKQIEKQHSDGR
jgi:hypothetical protein